ncbi:MAG: histidine phosphatase family protein, partial [Frisingicoccus sp.]|nr:histidine phosphatase family protein [Frisingicoccus sp.]
IIEKHKNDERVMIVAHGAVNKAMMRYMRKNEIKDFWMGKLQTNCVVTIVDCKDGQFQVLEDNKVFYE